MYAAFPLWFAYVLESVQPFLKVDGRMGSKAYAALKVSYLTHQDSSECLIILKFVYAPKS